MTLKSRAHDGHRLPPPEILNEIVRRIVAAVQPQRIILFGSAARGEVGAHSDLDLLVLTATADRNAITRTIRRALVGLGVAKDVIVVTPDDIARERDNKGLIICPALREGRVLYAA